MQSRTPQPREAPARGTPRRDGGKDEGDTAIPGPTSDFSWKQLGRIFELIHLSLQFTVKLIFITETATNRYRQTATDIRHPYGECNKGRRQRQKRRTRGAEAEPGRFRYVGLEGGHWWVR